MILYYLLTNMSTIVLCLDFSSAFDTVDHSLLLNVLEISFGITGSCFSWFNSYLSNRSFYVCIESSRSSVTSLTCGAHRVLSLVLYYLFSTLLNCLISSRLSLLIAKFMLMILIFTLFFRLFS